MQNVMPSPAPTRLAAGFQNPVHDGQQVFRSVMTALSRPGLLQEMPVTCLTPPAPLTPSLAAIALTLFDYDTPVWLDGPLRRAPEAVNYLRFHTGAPLVEQPVEAAFALISDPASLSSLGQFPKGTSEYPDTSATLILATPQLAQAGAATLSGPGVNGSVTFSADPLPPAFWSQAEDNHRLFPRGLDFLFASPSHVAGLPRSTQIAVKEG